MIRAAILCRVSTEGQRENTSLADQRRILTELCDRHGWAYEVFEEIESGAAGLANRPVLAAIMGRIAAGEFSRLVVLVQDRLSRAGVGELEQISTVLARVGARLVTQNGEYDPQNPDHVLLTDISAVVAKRERAAIRERTVRGREARAKAGSFTGHPVPFGWRRVWNEDGTTRFEIVPDQADVVRQLFEDYAEGTIGTQRLAQRYGIPMATVQNMLTSPRYVGRELFRRRGGRANRDGSRAEILTDSCVWPAIVSAGLWDRVQAVWDSRSHRIERRGPARWPLAGILRCEGCGHGLYRQSGANGYAYYYCKWVACEAKQSFGLTNAHRAVLAALPAILDHYAAVTSAPVDDDQAERLRTIEAALAAIEREELDLWRQKQTGLDEGLWRRLSDDLLTRRRGLEAQARTLAAKARRIDTGDLPLGDAARALAADESLLHDPERLRGIIVGVFEALRMRPGPRMGQRMGDPEVVSARLIGGVEWPL